MKGQISITVAIVGAVGMIVASVLTAFATTSSGVSNVRAEVEVIKERENNHYAEVQKQLSQIDYKLDKIIKSQ